MHFARKTLAVRFARELSPRQRIEYINNWKASAVRYASEWMHDFIEGIVQYSNESWVEIFGSYEDDPTPFYKALTKFSETIDEAERLRISRMEQLPHRQFTDGSSTRAELELAEHKREKKQPLHKEHSILIEKG